MKNKKNKTLLIGILFTIFVAVSFCMPKVEKVSADTCNGDVVTYYFLFSEGLYQKATYSDSTGWVAQNATISEPSTRYKYFRLIEESDYQWDNTNIIGSGKIDVVSDQTGNSSTQWTVTKFWQKWDSLQVLSDGYAYYRDAANDEVYSAAVKWSPSDGNERNSGVRAKNNSDRNSATKIATGNFSQIDANGVLFDPKKEAFNNSDRSMSMPFVIRRSYDSNNISLQAGDCPVNERVYSDGTVEEITNDSPYYCYHNVVYYYKICGTKNGESQSQSTTPSPQSTESTEPAKTIYTLIYDLNYGEEKGKDWHTQTSENDNTFDIYGKRPTREGYVFSGWADTEDGEARYQPDAKNAVVTFPDGVYKKRIYAVWVPEGTDYTVTYDANGGQGAPDSQTAPAGTCVVISKEKPTLEGNTFLGWNPNKYAPEASSTYAPGTEYCGGDITLYAVWQPNTGIKDYAMVAGILALAAGAGLLLVKRTNIFKQI